MRPSTPPLLRASLATLAVALAAAAAAPPARAQGGPAPAPASPIAGSWSANGDGQFDEARFDPDGSYVYRTEYPGGASVRSWGRFALTPTGPDRFALSLTPSGWTPRTFCGPDGRRTCRPLVLGPERLPVAAMPGRRIDFGGNGDPAHDPDGAMVMTRSDPDPALVAGAGG